MTALAASVASCSNQVVQEKTKAYEWVTVKSIGLDKDGKAVQFEVSNTPARLILKKSSSRATVTFKAADQIFGTVYDIGPSSPVIPITVKGVADVSGTVPDGTPLLYQEQKTK